ncbi:hypothetical protein GCM10007382_04210 [Salinibacterium xinjiangense]|uniref:Uncharacterized protein n=1 Tax=Salinibacterium xinjiangense TaxID=386302 RepID=A0A2C8ZLH3_9MICO|nr:hypothetical protein GCM10007382_04210 [Salinibacterium xinjiangense]SOE65814.1 hypothetical protein SAMN06296378_1624 [Salinibacterium xinjiangense]
MRTVPLTVELHGAMVQPGLDVRACHEDGTTLGAAVAFIHSVQVCGANRGQPDGFPC